jgi:hypothetical protein
MSEFNSRVEAQRGLLKIVNARPWQGEQLFALNEKAINRWTAANRLDQTSMLVRLLHKASQQIFAMANHSDDPICGTYRLSTIELARIGDELHSALSAT